VNFSTIANVYVVVLSYVLISSAGDLQWNIKKLCFEYDTDPYYQALDARVQVVLVSFFNLLPYFSSNSCIMGMFFALVSVRYFLHCFMIVLIVDIEKDHLSCNPFFILYHLLTPYLCYPQKYASSMGIGVFSPVSHTLFDPRSIIEKVNQTLNRLRQISGIAYCTIE